MYVSEEMRREIRCVRDPAQLVDWIQRVERLESALEAIALDFTQDAQRRARAALEASSGVA